MKSSSLFVTITVNPKPTTNAPLQPFWEDPAWISEPDDTTLGEEE